jgi:hypothetical protein
MGKFISKERVGISEETPKGTNTIYICSKMDYGTKNKVIGEAARISGDAPEVDVGAYQTALLVHNVRGWEGPDFKDEHGRPIPCTRANIEALDPDDALVGRVLEEIAARNPAPSADPKPSVPDGFTS